MNIVDNDLIEYLDNEILSKSKYQKILFLYDNSSQLSIIDEINNHLKDKSILTKFAINIFYTEEDFEKLFFETNYKSIILFTNNFLYSNIKNFIDKQTSIFLINSGLDFIFLDSYPSNTTINFSSKILHKISGINISDSYCSIAYILLSIFEAKFFYINDTNLFKNLCQIEKNIQQQISTVLIKNNISSLFNLYTFFNDYKDQFLTAKYTLSTLHQYHTLCIIFAKTLEDLSLQDFNIFDIYKSANKYKKYSTEYFDFINYYYEFIEGNNIVNNIIPFLPSLKMSIKNINNTIEYLLSEQKYYSPNITFSVKENLHLLNNICINQSNIKITSFLNFCKTFCNI